MACGCQGNKTAPVSRLPQKAAAAQAATAPSYEVLTARGAPTGRTFSSLVAATEYAGRIGGSTRPV